MRYLRWRVDQDERQLQEVLFKACIFSGYGGLLPFFKEAKKKSRQKIISDGYIFQGCVAKRDDPFAYRAYSLSFS